MRELVYEPKCGPKQRKRAPKLGKRASGGEMLSEAEETYLVSLAGRLPRVCLTYVFEGRC